MDIRKKEVYRYLGYHHIEPSAEVDARIDDCLKNLAKVCQPKSTHAVFPVSLHDDVVEASGMVIHSRGLAKNLRGCEKICLMAATLGIGPDRLAARAQLTSLLDAAIVQAAGAAMTEAWCDEVNERIRKEAAKEGLYCRPRFSPGYGDFPLSFQTCFSTLLNMPSAIGVHLTDALLMVPSKSVTAVIGMSRTPVPCVPEGCEACSLLTCPYRR